MGTAQQSKTSETPINPSFLNNSVKRYELEGVYHPNYRPKINSNSPGGEVTKSPLKGFFNHFLTRTDVSKSSSDIFANRKGEFYDKLNYQNQNLYPDDKRTKFIQ